MAAAFGATQLDGTYTKVFTATFLDNDAATTSLAVVFDGLAGRPSVFGNGITPLTAQHHRIDSGAVGAAGGASEFSTHTLSANGVTVRKLTASGAGANTVTVAVVVRAIQSIDR